MKVFFLVTIGISLSISAQTNLQNRLNKEVQKFLSTPKGKVSSLSYFVADEKENTIYNYQGEKGLTTASTQKIFTAATAMELLSPSYTYTTSIFTSGDIINQELYGDLILRGSGDPTLGSWRYQSTKPEHFLSAITAKLKDKKINTIRGDIYMDDGIFDIQSIPGGWTWQDIGNYYGAGVFGINWRENQFDLTALGNEIIYQPMKNISWINELTIGGNSDQSIIYTAPFSDFAYINGKLPAHKKMTISGAVPNPPFQLGLELKNHLIQNGISVLGEIRTASMNLFSHQKKEIQNSTLLLEWKSPTMGEIIYWFLKKSVNLYGENLLKTIAKEKTGNSQYAVGVDLLKKYWISKGIPEEMINFADGSGLSPKNYVSAKAEVLALLYSKKQPWFDAYFKGFPEQKNGMKMKSGTMRHTKSYSGIHQAKSGKNYYFAIIINNYQDTDLNTPLFNMLSPLKE